MPTVERIEVKAGRQIASQYLWCEMLVAVESLEITVYTSDGKTFTSAVPMAVQSHPSEEGRTSWVGSNLARLLAGLHVTLSHIASAPLLLK